ncbi:MAG: hypothetical protein K8L99_27975 [Anaerolineae bacterium]|nr:hypothetical protein [Anaerolineae bacterium]
MQFVGHLHPIPPYDFARSIAASNYHTVLDVARDGEYWRALHFGDETALVRVTSQGTLDQPALCVELAATTGPIHHADMLEAVAHILGVNSDLRPFYTAIAQDPVLWPIVESLYGLRHVRAASVFEALVTTVIEQQISLRQAQKAERWLVQWANNCLEYNGHTYFTFATARQIAAATVEDLTPLKITFRRMQVLIDVAHQQIDGEIDLEGLRSQSPQQAYSSIVRLKGIGQWTAGWTVIRSMGHYQYIGENDVALQAAINHHFYGETGRVAPQVVADTLGRYGDFAGAAAFFILMRWANDRY